MTKRSAGIAAALALSVALTAFGAESAFASADRKVIDIARSTSLAGNYLAAQIATRDNDDEAAVAFYEHSLSLDPDNGELKRLLFLALTANGRISDAVTVARGIPADTEQQGVIRLVTATDALKRKSFAKVTEILKEPSGGDLDQLVEKLVVAWAKFGGGDGKGALEIARGISGADWMTVVGAYHSGLLAAATGDDAAAIPHLEAAIENEAAAQVLPETYLRAVEALVRAHARAGNFDKAAEVLERGTQLLPSHPPFAALKLDLDAKKPLTPLVTSAQNGAAEILYNIGTAISRQGGGPFAQGYMQLADHLAPGSDVISMALASIFENQKQNARANTYYAKVAKDSPYHRRAELEAALNLNDLEQVEEAKAKLRQLIEEDRDDLLAYSTLGGVLSQHEEYAEASKVYETAISKIAEPQPHHWNLFYRRAISYERQKLWDKAEPDFKKALELSPNQADVLNYLGYSWVDMGINLEEGLEMIRKAVELSPRKGYIIDSLGWAYYKLGRYEEAVVELERAVELLPGDPVLNDHLGDAYWKVGRKLEATFQWNHALASKPEPEEEAKIRAKLEKGLVEEAKPTASSQ